MVETAGFNCGEFNGNTDLYITQNLKVLGTTDISNNPPNAKNMYFIPPDDPAWNQGNVFMVVNGSKKIKMTPDPKLCGYYDVTYFNTDPDISIIFANDVDTTWQIGLNGVDDVLPVSINLAKQFSSINPSLTLFFDAENGAKGWSASDPVLKRQCSRNLSMLVYDQDAAFHGAFSCDNYPKGTSNNSFSAKTGCKRAIPRWLFSPYFTHASCISPFGPTCGGCLSGIHACVIPVYDSKIRLVLHTFAQFSRSQTN